MAAFGRVFANGALSSWKDGNLKVLNATTTYANEVRTRAAIQRALVGLVSSTVGYQLYLYQHSGAWLVAGLLLLITAALAHYLLCADMGQKERSHNTLCEVLKLGSIQIRTHPGFRTVALLTGLLTFCTQAPNMQWPKFYGHLGTGTPLLGILGGSIPLFVAFGSYLAGRQYSTPRKIQKLLACTGVSLGITAALGGTYLGLAPFYLHEIFRGSVAILKENFIGREAKEEFRATIISLDSTAGHMGAIMGLVFSGVLATHLGINVTWIVSGCVLICASILIQAIKRSQ